MQRRLRNVLEHDARAEFSFPSPSSLVKLPNVLIQKFCYHGNVTSHFFSLFPFCCKVPVVAVLCKLNRRVFIVDSFSVKITGVTKSKAIIEFGFCRIMKNYPALGGCYPASASVDNTLLDLHNSSYPTKAEFNNY